MPFIVYPLKRKLTNKTISNRKVVLLAIPASPMSKNR